MKSLKSVVSAAALALFVSFSASAEKTLKESSYKVDAKSSSLNWNGKKVGGEHSGTVQLKEGTLKLKGSKLVGGSFIADLNTLVCTDIEDKTYNGKLIGHLRSDDFFSVDKYPSAKYVVTKVVAKSGNLYDVTGDLTIKGITKSVTVPVTVKTTAKGAEATGTLVVDRSKFDIKYNSKSFFDVNTLGDKLINDDFTIAFKLATTK
jgi:polyisoprenoid-binding protein YceI